MPRLELFLFRYRSERTGKWVVSRYRAELHEIKARFTEFEIVGPPEIRRPDPDARYFNPHAPFEAMMSAELRRFNERPPELATPLAIDELEVSLVRTFLRRYVTYCARRQRFAAMNRAARLFAELSPASR